MIRHNYAVGIYLSVCLSLYLSTTTNEPAATECIWLGFIRIREIHLVSRQIGEFVGINSSLISKPSVQLGVVLQRTMYLHIIIVDR